MSDDSDREWTEAVGCVCLAICALTAMFLLYQCDRENSRLRHDEWMLEHQRTTNSLPEAPK